MAKAYTSGEEAANVYSHGLGFLLSIAALLVLIGRAIELGGAVYVVSFSIFGVSLITLYGISTVYHSCKEPALRSRLRVLDHASIYLLIAGTYTPLTLITLQGSPGWIIFGISWAMAITGIVLKLFFTGKYSVLSTLMYVFMGWIIVFAINPLIDKLSGPGLIWLVSGGLAYTVGAVLYSIGHIRFNHAIFHVFVLIGSGCHFLTVYLYVV